MSNSNTSLEKESNMFSKFNKIIETISKRSGRQLAAQKAQEEKEQKELEEQRELEQYRKKSELSQLASKLLNAKLYDLFFKMVEDGYVMSESQKAVIHSEIKDIMKNSDFEEGLEKISYFLEKGYTINDDAVFQLFYKKSLQDRFFSPEFFDQNLTTEHLIKNLEAPRENLRLNKMLKVDDFKKYNLLIKQMRETLFRDDFKTKLSNDFLGCLYDYNLSANKVLSIPKALELYPHIVLDNVSIEKYLDFIAVYEEKMKPNQVMLRKIGIDEKLDSKIRGLLDKVLNEYYGKQLEKSMRSVKDVYAIEHIEHQTAQEITKKVPNYTVNNLPDNSKKTVQNLQILYTKLQSHYKELSVEDQTLLDNLFDKRIPEVLQKYFSIDPEYRYKLKNDQGKNAELLMQEALENYSQKLEIMLESANTYKLTDLSATQRYSNKL